MKKFLVVFAMTCLIAVPQISSAYSVSLTDFEGRQAEANIEIIGEGTNQITFELGLVDTIADIRGFFFNISGELSNFSIVGNDITDLYYPGNPGDLSKSANMNGTHTSFDVGVEIGTQGIGKDDIQSTTFTLYNDFGLELSDLFGMRLMSVGADREGSRKLLNTPEPPNNQAVPEPGTMILLGIGLLSLLGFRKKFRKR